MEKKLLLQLLLRGNLQNNRLSTGGKCQYGLDKDQHTFSPVLVNRVPAQVSREKNRASSSHPCSPVAAESHSHDQVTNCTSQQPAPNATPSTHGKDSTAFHNHLKAHEQLQKPERWKTTLWRTKLQLRYLPRPRPEQPGSGRLPSRLLPWGPSCSALSWSEHWDHPGHFPVLFLPEKKIKTYIQVNTLAEWPWQGEISCSTSKECLCKGKDEDQQRLGREKAGQECHSRSCNREGKNHDRSRRAE